MNVRAIAFLHVELAGSRKDTERATLRAVRFKESCLSASARPASPARSSLRQGKRSEATWHTWERNKHGNVPS